MKEFTSMAQKRRFEQLKNELQSDISGIHLISLDEVNEQHDEDDGQPSEYDEWQDYMGGDEYYDHSENEAW
tara:strand:+ start:475 stop:687 length:213 start_codon:yes stop_codon:yes gene_type:complete